MRALERLAEGNAVTTVALDLGYSSVSGFIALFRRAFGVTPAAHPLSRVRSALKLPTISSWPGGAPGITRKRTEALTAEPGR
ncbi:helix-turn-helix domain-containing protein [Bradyrhizobium sp. 40]|nr:helix-turn-helix domain-containing protein [Bradyrhizobium sp. 40]